MKLIHSLLIVTIAGGTLWAQAPAKPADKPQAKPAATPAHAKPTTAPAVKPSTPATTAAKAAATKKPFIPQAKPAAAPAKAAPAPAKQAAAPVKPAVAVPAKHAVIEKKPAPPVKQAAAPAKKEPAKKETSAAVKPEKVAKPASAKEEQTASRVAPAMRKRDPFVSPIVRATGGGPACETGKRCLMVDQITLKGIVKSPNGYIAVVENAARRAYFLRENDPIYNGSVVKITGDSVVFREETMDKLGKQGVREVVKKVNAPVV